MRRALWTALYVLVGGLPGVSLAQTAFDITNPAPRAVDVYVDSNFLNPSSVGTNLSKAFTGTWAESAGIGTVTVSAADSIAAFGLSGAPGAPASPGSWTDLEIEFDTSAGQVIDMRQTGYVTIDAATPSLTNRPFVMHLNTTHDAFLLGAYTSSCWEIFNVGPAISFPFWYSDPPSDCTGAGLTSGPTAFGYVTGTGRFNAIGPIWLDLDQIGDIPVYGTYGDAKLLEVEGVGVPFGATAGIALAVLLGAISVASARRRWSE